jgi:hypothetical protein
MSKSNDRNEFDGEWGKLLNELGALADRIGARSLMTIGKAGDPRMVSIRLFKRSKDHRNAFALLWNARLLSDSEIILRSAIETAICLANLQVRPEGFLSDLRSDAARTIQGQSDIWGSIDSDLGRQAKNTARNLFGQFRDDGKKHEFFSWKKLAEDAGVPDLYDWHKSLSGTSAHVTGLSINNDVQPVESESGQAMSEELQSLRRGMALRRSCGVAQISYRAHCTTMAYADLEVETLQILDRMSVLSQIDAGKLT